MYLLQDQVTRLFARYDSVGEHDRKVTNDVADAKELPTWAAASEYGQNFGPDWNPIEIFGDHGPGVRMGRAMRRELPAT